VNSPRKRGKSRYKIGEPKPFSVAEPPSSAYAAAPAIARVFQSGNSQAVRLPREFRVKANELLIFRRGDDIVLREKPLKLSELLAKISPLPDDFPDEIPDHPPESTEDL